MSKPLWRNDLQKTLSQHQPGDGLAHRVAVVGVGHELNGDDAAGIVAARVLADRLSHHSRVLIIDAGPAPENQTGALRRFGPDLVLLVDAANMNTAPGTACWLRWQDTTGISASTHTLPPYVLAQYLTAELGCDVALLGIQPTSNRIDAPLSSVMRQAIDAVVQGLVEELSAF